MTDQPYRLILIISLLLFLVSCNKKPTLDIQGHRGCRGLYPENSIPAFNKAIDLGVTTLELDVVLSKDFEVVVSHEPYLNPTICTNPNQIEVSSDPDFTNLYQLDYAKIRRFDCGSKSHPNFPMQINIKTHKPLLTEVFRLIEKKQSNVNLNIEIKSNPQGYGKFFPKPKRYVDVVMGVIENQGYLNRVTLQSFDINILEAIHKQYPEVLIALLVDDNENIKEKLQSLTFKPDIVSPFFKLLDEKEVVKYHEDGFKIIPWTVNTIDDLKMVLGWDVDGIITDYPDRLLDLNSN